jgi:hypothetical protein
MKSLLRYGPRLVPYSVLVGVLALGFADAQTSPQGKPAEPPAAIVRAVSVVVENDEPVVQITSSRPIPPRVTKLDNPSRLVIDLPNANMAVRRKRIDLNNQQISAVRIDQYQKTPAIVRVVVDLVSSTTRYSWDTVGSSLMVRLHPDQTASQPIEPPSVPAFTPGVQPAVVPVSPGTSGALVLADSGIASGSSVTAGSDTAILHIGRGGEVRVCPGTTVSVTTSQNGRALMLGMSTGALEAHYTLDASADSVLTPDFRILLAGPGEFHYAISADSRGNTCVRALPGNTASAIVSELMGDGTYQVKPSEQVVFRSGQLKAVDASGAPSCGCPAPPVPVMRASLPDTPVISEPNLPASMRLAQPGEEVKPVPPPASTTGFPASGPPSQVTLSVVAPETTALPATKPDEVHVEVEAPFVFRATDSQLPQPAPTSEAERLPMVYSRRPQSLQSAVLPPPAPPAPPRPEPKPAHRGVFGKIKGFFAAIFR